MTTRNLVPRADSQGKIGISGTRWEEVNAVTIKATSLQNSNGSSLLVNDAGIKDIATVNNQLVIALDGTFLTDRLGFNADSTKPDFALPNGDALPNNTIIAAGDSLVAAIQKLNDSLRDVADPTNLTVNSFTAATIVLEAEGISNNDNDTTLPTSAAVKDYVDSQITLEDLDFQGDAGGALSVDLNSQVLTIAGGTGLSSTGADQTLTLSLDDTAVTPGAYGSATAIPTFTVDQQGRLTAADSVGITTVLTVDSDGGGSQNVSLSTDDLQILGGTGLTSSISKPDVDGNPGTDVIVSINLDNTAVTPGSYGSATAIPTFTVDQQGRLTAADSVGITTTLTVDSDNAGTQNVSLAEDDLQILGGAGLTSSISKANNEVSLTLNLDDTAVAAAQYGGATSVGQFTVDAKGRLTQAANVNISIASSQVSDATENNTGDRIVLRDASGDFAAGTITATLTGNASTASKWASAQRITLGGDLSGNVDIDGSAGVTLTATIAANSVALGADTTGDYVESLVAGDGIALSNNSGEGSTPTIAVDGVLAQLDDLAPLADGDDDGKFIVATAANTFAYESGDTAKTSLGLGTGDSPEFSGLTLDNQGSLILKELNANGDHNVSIKSPAALAASYELVLPENDGSANEVLVTDGDGNLSWNTVEAAAGNAVNAFSIISVDAAGQENLVADTSQDTLNISQGSGIALTTDNTNGTDTLTISASNIDNDDIAAAAGIVDTKLATISTADKVSLTAINIDGGADIGAALADADLIIVDDGAGGTNKKSAMSRVATYIRTKDSEISSIGTVDNTVSAEGSLSVAQDLTVTGNLVVNGSQFQVDGTTVQLDDNLIELGLVDKAAPTGQTTKDLGLVLHRHDGANASKLAFYWDESVDKFKLETGITETNGIIDAGGTTSTLVANVEGNASTASALAASVNIGGVAFNGSASINLPGVNEAGNQNTSGNAATATEATNITATANNDTDETVYLTFVDGTTGTQGIETDSGLTYNPSSGLLTSTTFAGALSGNATTATALAATKTIGMTGDVVWTSAAFDGSGNVTGTSTIQDDAITGAKIDIISDGAITNAKLANSSVSFGGVSLSLGGTDATPAFDLTDATNYPTSSLSGTITNAQLAGSIANGKLENSSVSFGGVSLSLGGTDATPAFDLQDATNYPTSSLSGTITNAQLAGSIANGKLENSTVSFGGIQLSLGESDATPAFDLADATNYPTSSLSGTITNAQLAGSIADSKLDQITTADKVSISSIDLDGATALDTPLIAADLILVDDNAAGANRKATLAQLVTFLQNNTSLTSLSSLAGVGTITSGVWNGTAIADANVANDLTISGGTVNSSVIGGNSAAAGTFTTLVANTSLSVNGSAAITDILDEDNMASDSATALATQQSIKKYVDDQITAQDLDFQADAGGALSIDLDSETLTIAGGTGIDTSGADNTVTVAIDSTVTTLTGAQTLTNKTLTSPTVSGLSLSDSSIVFEGATSDDFETTLTVTDPTADRTITLPNASDTLVGLATTDTLTNKSIDADNNTISNLEVDNLKAGVLDTDLSSVAETDTTLASAKAIKAYVDEQLGRFGGIFLTDSADNGKEIVTTRSQALGINYDYTRDVVFDASPLVRSHFGPFAFDLQQLRDSAFGSDEGSDIIFYGATAAGASDRHFLVVASGDDKGDTKFTGAHEDTP